MHQGADRIACSCCSTLERDLLGAYVSSVGSHNIVAADLDGDDKVDLFRGELEYGERADGANPRIWLNRTASVGAAADPEWVATGSPSGLLV